MKILVCVKQVPDTWSPKTIDPATLRIDRSSADRVLNDLDEYAVEEALTLAEANGGEVTVLCVGPVEAKDTVRKALSMGADAGVLVTDDALVGADALTTATVLAAAIKNQDPDLVLFGAESTDARMGVIPAMVSEILSWPQLTRSSSVSLKDDEVVTTRTVSSGQVSLRSKLPAVVGVLEKINEPRYPSFKLIMAAKKKTITELSTADLGLDLASAEVTVKAVTPAPPRSGGERITEVDEGVKAIVGVLSGSKVSA